METTIIKIDNVWDAIIHSRSYNNIKESDEYKNYFEAQKHIFKTVIIPIVKQTITELAANNDNYKYIEINNIDAKYNKSDKYIKVELSYADSENINVIYNIFSKFKLELNNAMYSKYNLMVF